MLREIGGPGQQRLKAARVLIVGAGGLGSPAALYLAAAGVGRLGLVDPDVVSLSNLQRQVLYDASDLGRPKVRRAAERLSLLNAGVDVRPYGLALTGDNADDLVREWDLVLDGTDDFAVRFAVNAACMAEGKTLVSGAVGRWSGQVGVFDGRPCWRCLVRDVPPDAETCAAVGIVGALTGVIGSVMALEAVKLITDAGEPLLGRLLRYDALAAAFRISTVPADPACLTCGDGEMDEEGKLALLRRAVDELRPIFTRRGGHDRDYCVHALGRRGGVWRVFGWQFGGTSESGRIPEWRCFDVDDLSDLRLLPKGEWHVGRVVGDGRQTCMSEYDRTVPTRFTRAVFD